MITLQGTSYRVFKVQLELDPLSLRGTNIIQHLLDIPYIPGPTLKGSARSTLEKVFAELAQKAENHQKKKAFLPCLPAHETARSRREEESITSGLRRNFCEYDPSNMKPLCPLCTLFGAPGLVGFLNFGFLIPENPPNLYVGMISVLWEDPIRGWKFGAPRTIAGRKVDYPPLCPTPEEYLQWIVSKIKTIRTLGAGSKVRVTKIQLTEE